ncbi:MAG: VanW family protein [Akkermansiaceae bacterium]
MPQSVEKPIKRNKFRQVLGKEFYIAKRRLEWISGKQKWAEQRAGDFNQNIVFEHQSTILRKLKDVDMQLQHNKRTNLELAIAKLDQMVIRQGETFSIWRNVGRPTKAKGYKEGLVLQQGQLASGIGGGLCQLGNLLFWMFAHSPLTVTERYRHGFDVFPDVNRTVPFGAGATLSYNYIDLQAKNETVDDFKVELWLDKKFLHGRLLCESPLDKTYRVEERNHLMKQQFWGGYTRHNEIVQVATDANGNESERLLVKNDAIMMYSPMLASDEKATS